MAKFRASVTCLIWLLPSCRVKKVLLRLLGVEVAEESYVGTSLVWECKQISVGSGARVGDFNVFKNLSELRFEENALLGNFNWCSSGGDFAHLPGSGVLVLEEAASVTSRHFFDCSGGIRIGAFSTVAGLRTAFLSHGIDVVTNKQVALPVTVGRHSMVGSGAMMLAGSALPDRSVLAAGGVLARANEDLDAGLYTGVPAQFKRKVEGEYFHRRTGYVSAD